MKLTPVSERLSVEQSVTVLKTEVCPYWGWIEPGSPACKANVLGLRHCGSQLMNEKKVD